MWKQDLHSGLQPWLSIRFTWRAFKTYRCQGATLELNGNLYIFMKILLPNSDAQKVEESLFKNNFARVHVLLQLLFCS